MANCKRASTPSKPPSVTKKKKMDNINLKRIESHLAKKNKKFKDKTKRNYQILNDLLKSELMICQRRTRSKCVDYKSIINANNNDDGINDKNEESPSSPRTSPNPYTRKTRGRKPNTAKAKTDNNVPEETVSNYSSSTKVNERTREKYECDYCCEVFVKKSVLRRHIFLHGKLRPFRCNYCRKCFPSRLHRQIHIVKKHIMNAQIESYICDHCNKPFLMKENLSLHLSNHTKGIGFYNCAFCDKKFTNHYFLTEHESYHLRISKFQCPQCSAKFIARAQLILHVKAHNNVKDFICQYCGKEFLRPHSIKRHVEICHSGFRIQCPICNKKLKGHLTEHLRTHEKNKPHKCPECGQGFTQSTQLTVHRRSHTGVKPYECRICNKTFSHSNAMLLHFRRHTGEKPFQCAMCPLSFTQLPHMKTHMNKIHGRAEAYKCHKCNEFFKLKKDIDTHLKTCLGEANLTIEDKVDVNIEVPEMHSVMNLSRMRFLLALLLTMVASKSRLKCLGFNKRLIDDLLIDSLEAMGWEPKKDATLPALQRLKYNIEMLLVATIPPPQMKKFRDDNKSMEEILELLTDDKTSCTKIL